MPVGDDDSVLSIITFQYCLCSDVTLVTTTLQCFYDKRFKIIY